MANQIIQSYQFSEEQVDVKLFKNYKYAIPEHAPIKLSNGKWLHTYRLTPYDEWDMAYGDEDEEQEAVDRELYG